MILDNSLMLSNAQAITATANSTDIIDLGATGWWGGAGAADGIPIMLDVTADFTAAGAATLTISVRSTTAFDYTTGLKTHYVSDAIAKTALTAGANINVLFRAQIPTDAQRYLHLAYTVATGPMTAGAITAKVASAIPTNK